MSKKFSAYSLIILALLFFFIPGLKAEQAGIFDIQAPSQELFERAKNTLLPARTELADLLGQPINDKIRVFIARNRYDFDTAAFGGVPDWGVGVAIPQKDYISILSPVGENFSQSFEEVLRHELAHIAVHKRAGGRLIPRFMDEGFAMMFAHQWTFGDDITIAKARLTGSLYSLWEIDGVNMLNAAQARIAYSESYQAVKYIIDTFGKQTFQNLLDGFKQGKSRDAVFQEILGTSFIGFDKMFADYLKNNYHLVMILTDPIILWTGLVLLFLLGFILLRRKNKDIYKKWEEEEKLESTDFDYEESSPWD